VDDVAAAGWEHDAAFVLAFDRLVGDEGGYVNDPNDAGGETKFGISKRQHPTLDIKNLTREEAAAIYFRDFWASRDLGKLPVSIASKLFNLSVLFGPNTAILLLQRALRACGMTVIEDGLLGPLTIERVRAVESIWGNGLPTPLMSALRAEAACHARVVAGNIPDCKFLRGWLKRAYE
jgi:lysozyme family protein